MFVISKADGTGFRHHCNDIDTAADIVLGLTGDEEDYKRVANIMGDMKFTDIFSTKGLIIMCVPEYLYEGSDV